MPKVDYLINIYEIPRRYDSNQGCNHILNIRGGDKCQKKCMVIFIYNIFILKCAQIHS